MKTSISDISGYVLEVESSFDGRYVDIVTLYKRAGQTHLAKSMTIDIECPHLIEALLISGWIPPSNK